MNAQICRPGASFEASSTKMPPLESHKSVAPPFLGDGQRRVHVLLLPYPARGHSIPLVHFAMKLNSFGVTVTFVDLYQHLSVDRVFESLHALDSMRVVTLGVPSAKGAAMEPLPYVDEIDNLVGDTEKLVENLTHENPESPPDCIVSDMFLGWTQAVANKFKIPRYVLFASPANGLATHLHCPALLAQGVLPTDPSRAEELVYDIPGVPPTKLEDLPSPVQAHTSFMLWYIMNGEQMMQAAGMLINTYYELEPVCIDALRTHRFGTGKTQVGRLLSMLPVGPMLPATYFSKSTPDNVQNPSKARHPCLNWLDAQPESSVIFISFGSVAVLPIHQIHELALGLEASQQRFLLVVKTRSDKTDFTEVWLPRGFVTCTEERGLVVNGWVPQLEILSSPAVGGFLTHCGWNSSLESICRGVPMLAWPIQAEQFMNRRMLVDDLKVAVEVFKRPNKSVGKEEVERAVRCLMEGPEGKNAKIHVERLKGLATAAVEEGGSVPRNLKKFIDEIKAWNYDSYVLTLDKPATNGVS